MKSMLKLKLQFRNLQPRKVIASSKFQAFGFSGQPKAATQSKSSKTQQSQRGTNAVESSSFSCLFDEITKILGTEILDTKCETLSGFSVHEDAKLVDEEVAGVSEELTSCTLPVCDNAQENLSEEKTPIINEITAIVRAKDDAVSMEERLELSGLRFDAFVLEKVLKRCFKTPHLALRFFNWVKLRDGFCHTTETYHAMLQIAGEAKEFGLMEELMVEMEKNSSCEKDVKTWTILISHFGKAKLVGKSLLAFEKMKKWDCEPDERVYSSLIDALCRAGKPDTAMEFYKETIQKEMVLNMNIYKTLMNCIARSEDAASVCSIADDIAQLVGTDTDIVYGHMLRSFCIAGRITEALETMRSIKDKNLPLVPEYCETLIKGLCRVGQIQDALEIVGIMEKRHLVSASIYGIIISGYLRDSDVNKALDLFGSMKEGGHVPTRSTYTELIQKFFRLNDYQVGMELFNEMMERGIEPDQVTVMAMVSGHVSQSDISGAWRMLRTMEEKGIKPTHKFYSVFLNELCKVGRTDEVIKVLNEMQACDVVIRDEIFQRVISFLEKKGELENLEAVRRLQKTCKNHFCIMPSEEKFDHELNSSQHPQIKPDVSLIEPPIKAYNENEVKEISRILTSTLDWSLMQEDLEKCAIKYSPEFVLEVLENCKLHGQAVLNFFHWVGKQDGYSHTTETYNMAIKIAGSGKSFTHMRSLFYEMKRNGYTITPHTWTIMIMQYGRNSLTNIALQIFEEMKAHGFKPVGSTYKFLITCFCGRKGRKVDEAIKLFQEMIRAQHVPDKDLIETYLLCLCETNKLLDARNCIEYLSKVGFTNELRYSLYIRALCRTWRVEEALKLANEFGTGEKLHTYVYASIIHGLLREGKLEAALAKADDMKQAGISPTVHVYTSLIGHFFKEKKIDKAMEIFEKMKAEGCEPTVITYSVIIHGYVNASKVDEAWTVFNQIKENGPVPDFRTYEMFIKGLCRIGRSEEALKLLSEMFNSRIAPSSILFRTVLFGLNREGKQHLACTVQQQKKDLTRLRKF